MIPGYAPDSNRCKQQPYREFESLSLSLRHNILIFHNNNRLDEINQTREPDAQKRNQIIRHIDKTLLEVQSAIVSLPSTLLLAGVNESEPKKAAGEMARAADKLNTAAAALSNTNSGKASQSVRDIRKALAQIQQERLRIASSGNAPQTTGQDNNLPGGAQ